MRKNAVMRKSQGKIRHVLIATPMGQGGKGGIDRIMDGVRAELERNPPADLRVYFAPTRGGGHILLSPLFLMLFLMKMVVLRLIHRCDLLHINVASRGSTYRKRIIAALASVLGIPYVVHLHGALYQGYFAKSTADLQESIRRLFIGAARTIVLGNCWQDFVVNEIGVSPACIVTLPNAVPVPSHSREPHKDGKVRILFLGRLGPRKGSRQLVEALAYLTANGHWRATLAGDGDVEITRAEVSRLGLDNHVTIPGWSGPKETEVLLSQSDILVLPSFAENLPMSVVEGMAMGLAIVTTPVGATPDIVKNEVTGLLVPPGDVEALSFALDRVISDEGLRVQLGEAARDFHRKYLETSTYTRRLTALWREVAG